MKGILFGPTPVYYTFYNFKYVVGDPGDVPKNRVAKLKRLQLYQPYSIRDLYAPVIKIDPELPLTSGRAILLVTNEDRKWKSLKKKELCDNCTRTIIKLYKPRIEPKKPKYMVIFATFEEASTRMGARRRSWLTDGAIVKSWVYVNVSRTGNHELTHYIVIGRIVKPIIFEYEWISNRGRDNTHFIICSPRGCAKRNSIDVIRKWPHGIIYKNWDGRVIAELEYQQTKKTAIEHRVEGPVRLIECESPNRTYYRCWYELKKSTVKIITARITDSGKKEQWEITY